VIANQNTNLGTQTLEELLFQFSLCDFDFDGLINLLRMSAFVVCVVLNCGREKGTKMR
jgi:hypothetical protein